MSDRVLRDAQRRAAPHTDPGIAGCGVPAIGRRHGQRGSERHEAGICAEHLRLFIVPVVVTNAALTICRFDPAAIKIEDGTLTAADAVTETVPFIRFRKSVTAAMPEGHFSDLRSVNRARERTVFVVTASHLSSIPQRVGHPADRPVRWIRHDQPPCPGVGLLAAGITIPPRMRREDARAGRRAIGVPLDSYCR